MDAQHPTAAAQVAAYCDVDGTLTDTTIVTPLVYLKRRALSFPVRWLWLASLALHGPAWLALDAISRAASNRAIYRHYRGLSAPWVREQAEIYYRERIRPKLFKTAEIKLREFQRRGVRLVLVTGGLDVFMAPMARDWQADCLAPKLEEREGWFTGHLSSEPFTGTVKARLVREHAAAHGVDLQRSYALGDAAGDLPMLECAGHPMAINPDRRLARIAAERGWQVENWR